MERLTIKKMVEDAEVVARMTDGKMVANSFYVYSDIYGVKNNLTVTEAVTTYIDLQDAEGYNAIGINYDLADSQYSPLATDVVNNKHGFTYICKDYEKMNYSESVTEVFEEIADVILKAYGRVLQLHDQNRFAIHFYKVKEQREKDIAEQKEAKRIANLPYIKMGRYSKCKVIAEKNGYELIMNEEALESTDYKEKKYGYISRSEDGITPLGKDREEARKIFTSVAR